MVVRVDSPALKVILIKKVKNQAGKSARYQGPQKTIDLAPWLTDDASVSISRQINAPAGTFQITLSDRAVLHAGTMDSLYGVVEPMDMVEIRMARKPSDYPVGVLPLVFRGIVSTIGRDETIGQDGRPRRTIAIGGHDWGKFFNMIQTRWYKGNPLNEDWLSSWRMQAINNIQFQITTAAETVESLINNVANKFIRKMPGSDMPEFTVDVSMTDPADKVFPQGFQTLPGGTLWTYLQTFGDLGPFYEMFIEDEEAAPKLVYRKPPFLTILMEPVYLARPEIILIDPVNITRISVSRSDSDVANWWWIDHQRLSMIQGQMATWYEMSASDSNPFLDTPNTDRLLYGNRPMEVVSHHGFMHQSAKEEQVNQETLDMIAYSRAKRLKLQAANKDNVIFESGQLTMAGNEAVKVGRSLVFDRGGHTATYYVQGVSHTFQPFRSFTTTVNFVRGTGFAVRTTDEIGTKHPYLSEIGHGPYEG